MLKFFLFLVYTALCLFSQTKASGKTPLWAKLFRIASPLPDQGHTQQSTQQSVSSPETPSRQKIQRQLTETNTVPSFSPFQNPGWLTHITGSTPEIALPPRYLYLINNVWHTQSLSALISIPANLRKYPRYARTYVESKLNLHLASFQQLRDESRDRIARTLAWPASNQHIVGIRYVLGKDMPPQIVRFSQPLSSDEHGILHVPIDAISVYGARSLVDGQVAQYQFIKPDNTVVPAPVLGSVHVIAPQGWSIITDIDDTLRDSRAINPSEFIQHALFLDYRSIPGMSHLFQSLENHLSTPASKLAVHYVSGSPMSILKPTMAWLDTDGFPRGPMHFVEKTVASIAGINSLRDVINYKNGILKQIIRDFPGRRFIFFGDSGQHDPAIYAKVFRKIQQSNPKQVENWCIYIRKVQGINVKKEAVFNRNERFLEDFRGIPPQQWMVFDHANQLNGINPASGSCYPPGSHNSMTVN